MSRKDAWARLPEFHRFGEDNRSGQSPPPDLDNSSFRASDEQGVAKIDVPEAVLRGYPEQLLDSHFGLQTGEGRAEAQVRPVAESQMGLHLPVDVETLRIHPAPGIAVCGRREGVNELTGRHLGPSESGIPEDLAGSPVDRPVQAEPFLDGGRHREGSAATRRRCSGLRSSAMRQFDMVLAVVS